MQPTLEQFLEAMSHEWVTERYSVDEYDGRLRVHYRSKHNGIEWSHRPYNELSTIPKIGSIGMLGFIGGEAYQKLLEFQKK